MSRTPVTRGERERAARDLIDAAMTPRTRSEETLGVDLDVAAMRIMSSSATDDVKQTACAGLLRWAQGHPAEF